MKNYLAEKDIEEYLSGVDKLSPDDNYHYIKIKGNSLIVHPGVWNPLPSGLSRLFIDIISDYDIKKFRSALDMGAGSGILSLILFCRGVKKLVAVDIMDEALINAKLNFKSQNINIMIVKSDLFENIQDKFDLIVFNAPATHPKRRNVLRKEIPLWSPEENIRIRFLNNLNDYLNDGGTAIFPYCRFPDFDPIPEKIFNKYPFTFNYLARAMKNIFEIGVIEVKK